METQDEKLNLQVKYLQCARNTIGLKSKKQDNIIIEKKLDFKIIDNDIG